MCTVKFSIELNTLQIDKKGLNTNNICEKSEQILKMDGSSVNHPPFYTSFFLDNALRPGKS